MVSGLPLFRRLAPAVEAALDAAVAVSKGWGQDYIGAEHLFCGILQTEEAGGTGRGVLELLEVDPEAVLAMIAKVAGSPAGRGCPVVFPLTARCLKIFRMAERTRRKRREAVVDAGHLMEAILAEGWNVPLHCVAYYLEAVPLTDDRSPAWLVGFVRTAAEAQGEAWSFPVGSVDAVLGAVQPDLLPWDRRKGPQSFKIAEWWHTLTGLIHQSDEEILVFLAPKLGLNGWERRWYRRFYRRHTEALRRVAGGRYISPARFYAGWPDTAEKLAGVLNRGLFQTRAPVGRMRRLEPGDEAFCVALYGLLEETGQVPRGFMSEFVVWLGQMPDLRYAIEMDGRMAGCGGISWTGRPQSVAEAADAVLDIAIPTFGLIHPDEQGRGLGTTQLAARLALARRLGCREARVSATEQSVDWLERLGFNFWRIDGSMPQALGFMGTMLLTDDDADYLEAWLGWGPLEFLLPQDTGNSGATIPP